MTIGSGRYFLGRQSPSATLHPGKRQKIPENECEQRSCKDGQLIPIRRKADDSIDGQVNMRNTKGSEPRHAGWRRKNGSKHVGRGSIGAHGLADGPAGTKERFVVPRSRGEPSVQWPDRPAKSIGKRRLAGHPGKPVFSRPGPGSIERASFVRRSHPAQSGRSQSPARRHISRGLRTERPSARTALAG